jgi:NitT/TauT family transport system permease protein
MATTDTPDQTGQGHAKDAKGGARPRQGMRIVDKPVKPAKRIMQSLLIPIGLLILWEIAGQMRWISPGITPHPSRVAEGWWTWAFGPTGMGLNPYSGTWASNVLNSATRVFQGYALAVLFGIPVGIMIGWSKLVSRLIDPMVQSLRPIPITAWLPFSIALFGIKDFGAIFLIALGAFYPIVVNATQGARDSSLTLIRAASMMGANRTTVLMKVVFPSALPSIFTGMRIGLGIAWTAVIVAEMVAVKSGLGYVLWDAYYVGRMDIVVADMVSIGILGFLTDRLIVTVESRVLRWQQRR